MRTLFLLLSLCLLTVNSNQVMAQKKGAAKATQGRQANAFPYVYEKIWFAGLSKKQQMVYLDTLAKLSLKMSGKSRSAALESLDQLLFDFAEAADNLSNGFVYQGTQQAFFSSLALGPLQPTCPAGEMPCAPYTGLVRTNGNLQVACSPNSTPMCVQRGDRSLLQGALSGCSNSSSELCNALNANMRRSTEGVREWCQVGQRASRRYCTDALAALENAEIPVSPQETNPTGGDCEEMSRQMAEAHDRNRGPQDTGPANNSFWRGMTGFAQQACGRPSVTSAMNVYGICDVGNMEAPDGTLQRKGSTTSILPGQPGHQECVEKAYQEKLKDRRPSIERRLQAGEPCTKQDGQRVTRGQMGYEACVRNSVPVPTRAALMGQSCTETSTEAVTGPDGRPVTRELELSEVMALIPRFRAGTALSQDEENRFIAATGMRSSQFRQTFCNQHTHGSFKTSLRGFMTVNVDVAGQGSIADLYRGQMEVARYKMARCLSSLKSNGEASCRFYDHNDYNILREASPERPILVRNRENNRCSLVVGLTREDRGFTTSANGTQVPITNTSLRVRTPGSERVVQIQSESMFARENEIKIYRCDGDRVPSVNYVNPDAAGEAEAAKEENSSI